MANALEHELDYPFGDLQPAMGGTAEVAPGVRWVRMALPFALNHINLWLLRDRLDGREGWTIVDAGLPTDATKAAWEQVFAAELHGLPVLRLIVTHMHPDHVGLAHWLTERWSGGEGQECRLWMSATDWNNARAIAGTAANANVSAGAIADFMARHGVTDRAALEGVRGRGNYYGSMVPAVPRRMRRLMDGLVLDVGARRWTCRVGRGHSPEHISLYCAELGVLISGDMVLPRISTNMSVIETEPEADPLRLYLDSLDALHDLPEHTLVLPSHGKPFRGLHARIRQLHAHHEARLAEVLHACAAAPRTAAEVMPVMFDRELTLHEVGFAMGETIAHLNTLWLAGRLTRRLDGGVYRFAARAQAGR